MLLYPKVKNKITKFKIGYMCLHKFIRHKKSRDQVQKTVSTSFGNKTLSFTQNNYNTDNNCFFKHI